MTIQHTEPDLEPSVQVNNNCISTIQSYEYLGMILHYKLDMNDHIDNMGEKANTKVGILSKTRQFNSQKTAINIYKCMIRPHLDYIDFVIDSGTTDRIKILDRLQAKAVRRIEYCFDKNSRTEIVVLQKEFNIESSGAGKLGNLGAGGAPSSQILRALTKIYGPSVILFRT